MSKRAPALHRDELTPRLEPTGVPACDVLTMLPDTENFEFQAIADRNSQLIFLEKYAIEQYNVSMLHDKLTAAYQISKGHVRCICCVARKREEHPSQPIGRPHKLANNQEREVIEMILTAANDLNFPTKREILDEIENQYHKVLTYGEGSKLHPLRSGYDVKGIFAF